jgi:hypothetical protein
MNTIAKLATTFALLSASLASNAQSIGTQSVTFDFTGSIADATYADPTNAVLIPDGNLVTGSFTFTYAPLFSNNTTNVFGTIGTSSPGGWLAESAGFGPGTMLFSSTVQVVGFSTSYSSGDTGVSSSLIRGGSTTGINGNPCGGHDDGISQLAGGIGGCETSGSGLVGSESWITLNPDIFGSSAFSSDGLPDLSDTRGGSGEFMFYTNGPSSSIFGGASGIEFGINSIALAPGSTLAFAPEIDASSAASGLTLLLGGLLVLRGRRPMKLQSATI